MAAHADDLTTVARVKSHLGIADTVVDTLLQTIITAASRWMLSQMKRNIRLQTYTETFNGDGTIGITLTHGPVTTITSVTVDGETITARATVADIGYVLQNDRLYLVGYSFPEGIANVVVVYTAGYTTVPEDLDQACVELVSLIYRSRDRKGMLSRSDTTGSSVSFAPEAVPFITDLTMDAYRRVLGVPQ